MQFVQLKHTNIIKENCTRKRLKTVSTLNKLDKGTAKKLKQYIQGSCKPVISSILPVKISMYQAKQLAVSRCSSCYFVRPVLKKERMFFSCCCHFFPTFFLIMYLWWSLCTLHLHACQVRVTVGDSGLCCVF